MLFQDPIELIWTCAHLFVAAAEDSFILYLFDIIEQLSDDANDPYHYSIIRVLVKYLSTFCSFSQVSTNVGPRSSS